MSRIAGIVLTGGYDGLRGFSRMPLDFGLFTTRHHQQRNDILFLHPVRLRRRGGAAGLPAAHRRSAARLLAIRENERRARFLGIPVERHIWLSFSISCFFTALAGSLYALLNNFADPLALHYITVRQYRDDDGDGRHASVLGSAGRRGGVRVLQDYVSSMTMNWMCFVGCSFVLVVLFFPRGLLGMLARSRARACDTMLEVRRASKQFGSLVAVHGCLDAASSMASCAPSSGRTAPARRRSST